MKIIEYSKIKLNYKMIKVIKINKFIKSNYKKK